MINFRKKSLTKDQMSVAIDHLEQIGLGQKYKKILSKDADAVSKVNSKSMVLEHFIETANGDFEIKVRDKSLYNYTKKLLGELLKMRITDINPQERSITAEVTHLGMALDIIELLVEKYELSIVTDGKF